jgi:hypothetical protein
MARKAGLAGALVGLPGENPVLRIGPMNERIGRQAPRTLFEELDASERDLAAGRVGDAGAAQRGGGLAVFLWSLRSGQYDDLEGAANRILFDDEER